MSKNKKGLGGLSDDQLEILYRQTQDGMRKKGLPSKRRTKGGGYANYTDEDHSRARTIDKDFYRGNGSFQYNDSDKGKLERAFGVKKDPEKDPSMLFNQAFGDKYQRKNLSNKDIANMMIDVKDERYKRKFGDKGGAPVAGAVDVPEKETVTERPDTRPEMPSQPEQQSLFDQQVAEGNDFDFSKYDGEAVEAPGTAEYAKAKEKAQAYTSQSGSNVDYSFEGGSYGDATRSQGSDVYGNATVDKVKEEHASDLLNKYKSGIVYGA